VRTWIKKDKVLRIPLSIHYVLTLLVLSTVKDYFQIQVTMAELSTLWKETSKNSAPVNLPLGRWIIECGCMEGSLWAFRVMTIFTD
jgi:hypothetical protein